MHSILVIAIAFYIYVIAIVSADATSFNNCRSDVRVLERALYQPENIVQLNRVFYPPREPPSRFIIVTYEFEDVTNCSVTYIWAVGGFLLIQPPTIFQLTSLYFSTAANELTDLLIKLPQECLPLVGDNCTCVSDDNKILDILTQQLGEYAKHNRPDLVVRDASIHVQAICDMELKGDYYAHANTRIFMACTGVIPIFFIAILSIIVRSHHSLINNELAKERNHGNLAALIAVGIFIQCVIVGMDIAAVCYVYTKQYEYRNYHLQHTANLFVTAITLAFDMTVGLIMFFRLMYLWCALIHRDATKNCPPFQRYPKCCLEIVLSCCVIPCFYAIFGDTKQEQGLDMPESYENVNNAPQANQRQVRATNQRQVRATNQRMSWILLNVLIAPLFSLASHSGYILVAWLTEPSKTTATALIAFALIISASLIFRQCYKANASVKFKFRCWSIAIFCCPCAQCIVHVMSIAKHIWHYIVYKSKGVVVARNENEVVVARNENEVVVARNENQNPEEPNQPEEDKDGKRGELTYLLLAKSSKFLEKPFNLQAFCIVMGWGIIVTGMMAYTVIAFYELPLKTLDLISYLLNIFQIFIVVITLLITYKIFMLTEPDIQRFLKQIRKTYKTQQGENGEIAEVSDDNVEDIEATGAIAGKALKKIINRGLEV